MVAVAAICVKAPASTQGQNTSGGRGKASPTTAVTPARNSSANGKPNRKRTCVAPTVPSVAVSSRCMALRAVCAAAAISVKTAQSIVALYTVMPGHSRSEGTACFCDADVPGIHVVAVYTRGMDGRVQAFGDDEGSYAAADLISAASGNSLTLPCSLSISRNRSK